MKANNLIVGDYIRIIFNQKIVKVKEIKQTCIYTEDNGYGYNEIEPISITAEILKKNDFVINKHVYPYPYYEYINEEDKTKIGFAFPQGNKTSYKEPWIYIDTENVFVEHLPCIFVHQFQHVLKFCNVNKEIVM